MLYTYLNNIEKQDLFKYFTISLFAFFFVTKVLQIDTNLFIGLIISVIIFNYVKDKKDHDITDTNTELEYKLAKIKPKPKYFHMDANLVNLFYNVIDFREYNTKAYEDCVKATDNVLKIHEDFEKGLASHCHHNIDIAKEQANNAVNYFHTYIYSLPTHDIYDAKFKTNKDRLQLLLRRHIDDMYLRCRTSQRLKDVDTHGGYHMSNQGPRPDDSKVFNNKPTNFDFHY